MLYLIRNKITDNAIVGELHLNGVFLCYTMENKKTAIPCGKYKIENSLSPKFKRELPLIYNDTDVKPQRGIRIHCGTDYQSSSGCVLVAMDVIGEKLKESKVAEQTVTIACRNTTEMIVCEI